MAQAVTLHKFGIDGNTIRRCEQHLQMLNAERPVGHVYSNNALGARFLACITFPDTLLADAIKEMSVPTIVFPLGTPGNDSSGHSRLSASTTSTGSSTCTSRTFRLKSTQARSGQLRLPSRPRHTLRIALTVSQCQRASRFEPDRDDLLRLRRS